jgi:hypothetical protein
MIQRSTHTQSLRQHGLFPAQSSGRDKENSNQSKGRKIHEEAFFIMSTLK